MKKEFICIVCPQSCRLQVEDNDGEIKVTGYSCKRGIEYGKNEFTVPQRMLTTTVAIEKGTHRRLSVISEKELPKEKLTGCIENLYSLKLTAPVKMGDVIVENICNTGVNIIASRSMKIKEN